MSDDTAFIKHVKDKKGFYIPSGIAIAVLGWWLNSCAVPTVQKRYADLQSVPELQEKIKTQWEHISTLEKQNAALQEEIRQLEIQLKNRPR